MLSRSVLITGGSSGIGRATVKRFSLGADRVWFTYHSNEEGARSLEIELAGTGAKVEGFEFDQGDRASHERLLERLPGPVDVLVNNAAVGSKTVERHTGESIEEQDLAFLRINSVGPLWLTRQVLPMMLRRGYGKIINISSVGGGIATFPDFHIADGMSKAALTYMTRHFAAQLVHSPIDVFGICPGAVETPMLRASLLDDLTAHQYDELRGRLPGNRLIQPEEIGELAWWLAGDHSSTLRGAILDASLGLGVHPGLLTGPSRGDAG